jgi:predicted secreted protein
MDFVKIVIQYLEQRITDIKNMLKDENNKHLLPELKEVNNAINWLKKIDELKLKNVQKYEIIELPEPTSSYFSSYRIMEDREDDDSNQWIEFKKDTKPVLASMGDILIIKKPKLT